MLSDKVVQIWLIDPTPLVTSTMQSYNHLVFSMRAQRQSTTLELAQVSKADSRSCKALQIHSRADMA